MSQRFPCSEFLTPLNSGGDPDSRSGFQIQNIIFLKSLSTQSLFLRAPCVDQKRECGECPKMLGYVRLYWPNPHGFYLAPFPEECRSTLIVSKLFNTQHWKVLTSAYHLPHNNGNCWPIIADGSMLIQQYLCIYIYSFTPHSTHSRRITRPCVHR